MMDVQIYRELTVLSDGSPMIPRHGSDEAAGYDVCAFLPVDRTLEIKPLTVVMVPTGLYLAEEQSALVLACCRSGLATKGVHLVNSPGVIDSDYRGEIKMILTYIANPLTAKPFIINHGDRIAQLVFFSPGKVTMNVNFVEVTDKVHLRPTGRGEGGFGSTGR